MCPTRIAVVTAILAALPALTDAAQVDDTGGAPAWGAARPWLGLGALDEIDGRGGTLITVHWLGPQRHPWELMLGLLGARPKASGGDGDPSHFAAVSRRWTARRWFVGLGAAVTDADDAILSGHLQWMTMAGWRGDRLELSVRHLSNGNLAGRNRGETWLTIAWHLDASPAP